MGLIKGDTRSLDSVSCDLLVGIPRLHDPKPERVNKKNHAAKSVAFRKA